MFRYSSRLAAVLLWFAALGFCSGANAEVVSNKPFAVAKVVLQLSNGSPAKETLVLNVAHNLLGHYGQDRVDIEIVAFGPGLRLLFADNVNKGRIAALAGAGVRFSACSNTMAAMTKILGHRPKLNPHAKVVGGGVVRIIELEKAGYTLIKP
jgi:intracellular sulfur oxidation DsrE/DsrF family protein